jgi:hypothetical protein
MADTAAEMQKKSEGGPNSTIRPIQDAMAACTGAYVCGPHAAATNQTTRTTAQALKNIPVIRLRIERTDVSCGR